MSEQHRAPKAHRLWLPRRRYVLTFVGFLLAAIVGVASAQWISNPPTGHGKGYGKGGKKSAAAALTTVDVSSTITDVTGPEGTGWVSFKIHNPNAFAVNVAQPTFGTQITVPTVPTCVANSPADFTLASSVEPTKTSTPMGFPQNLAGGADLTGVVQVTTTDTFPDCLADQVFTVDLSVDATVA